MRPHILLFGAVLLLQLAAAPAATLIEITDQSLTDPRRWREVAQAVEKADEAGIDAIVFKIDAAGTHPEAAFRRVFDTILKTRAQTVSLVDAAVSAGAALALSTDAIYLTPYGVIGAALPQEATAPDDEDAEQPSAARNRSVSVISARLKGIARAKGRDADLVGDLAEPTPEGRVLTLNAEEAVDAGLALAVVADLAALEAEAGLDFVTETEAETPAEVVELSAEAEAEAEAEDDDGFAFFGRDKGEDFSGKVVVIAVGEQDLLAKARFEFMKRNLLKAEAEGAAAVVFDMHTPGGIAWYTAELMMQAMQQISVPTYTYVNPSAVSAGALIAIATDEIWMAPAATIGAAAVVSGAGGDLGEAMQDKVNATFISVARNVAELKGHNPDVVEAFIDSEKEVVIDGVTVSPAGRLLSLNTTTATEEFNGRPLLAEGVATDLEDLLDQIGLGEREVVFAEPLGLEAFAQWVQGVSIFLIVLGIAGAYLEAQSPGFGIPGFISMLCFALFFFGNNLAGKLAGYELAVIFALGVILLAVEIFLLPGVGIAGVLGGGLMLGSLLFAMVDRVDFQAIREDLPSAPGLWEAIQQPLFTLTLGAGGAALIIALAMVYLPKTPAMRRMVLEDVVGGGSAAVPAQELALPDTGVALTDLRPEGRAQFGEAIVDVVADGTFVRAGTAIRITDRQRRRILVEEVA